MKRPEHARRGGEDAAPQPIAADVKRRTGVTLFPHQVTAIQWMQRTERRPRMVSEQPHGGILAHEMGLGKTITCLCTILLEGLGSTIIVCPKSVITQWRDEAVRILGLSADDVVLYHGANRDADLQRSTRHHRLVLTTFDIVRMDTRQSHPRRWSAEADVGAAGSSSSSSSLSPCVLPLHGEQWDRIVLDEAHRICEQSSKTARAIHTLRARNRWCITGTPFKNGVTDLVALAKFLAVPPYCNPTWWRANSHNPHKLKEWRNVFLNLQNKSVLSLPAIVYETRASIPTAAENQVIAQIQTVCYENCTGAGVLHLNTGASLTAPKPVVKGDGFVYRGMPLFVADAAGARVVAVDAVDAPNREGADALLDTGGSRRQHLRQEYELLRIIRLRQAANHPLLLLNSTPAIIRLATVQHFSASGAVPACDACANFVDLDLDLDAAPPLPRGRAATGPLVLKRKRGEEHDPGSGSGGTLRAAGPTRCDHGHILCHACAADMILCPCCTADALPVTTRPGARTVWRHSSKTRELADHLEGVFHRDPAAKVVLFSQWTTCLDLLAALLTFLEIGFARFDGRVNSIDERGDIIHHFKTRVECSVLLTSLGAGGEGLNLTFANHVILMEPYWNLAVEQQAIDRLYRIGQHRVTRVLRLYLQDSIENWVQDIQQAKDKELKRLLLGDTSAAHVADTGNAGKGATTVATTLVRSRWPLVERPHGDASARPRPVVAPTPGDDPDAQSFHATSKKTKQLRLDNPFTETVGAHRGGGSGGNGGKGGGGGGGGLFKYLSQVACPVIM